MSLYERELYGQELRFEHLREEADFYRFERDVLGIRSDLPKPCCATLAWLGRRLIDWGEHMQAKYGNMNMGGDLPTGAH